MVGCKEQRFNVILRESVSITTGKPIIVTSRQHIWYIQYLHQDSCTRIPSTNICSLYLGLFAIQNFTKDSNEAENSDKSQDAITINNISTERSQKWKQADPKFCFSSGTIHYFICLEMLFYAQTRNGMGNLCICFSKTIYIAIHSFSYRKKIIQIILQIDTFVELEIIEIMIYLTSLP